VVDTVGSGEGADGWGDGVVAVGGFGFGFGLGSGFGLVCGAGVDWAGEECGLGFGVGELAWGAGCGESVRVGAGTVRDANCALAAVDDDCVPEDRAERAT